jgi:hypothetical protein
MSIWDEITSAADNYSLNDAKNGVGALFDAYTQVEKTRATGHENAKADQAAARYVPEIESQSVGDPVSLKPQTQQRELVGEVPKDAAVIDKKIVYAGGALLALLLVGGLIMAVKK